MSHAARWLYRLLEVISVTLLLVLATVVVVAVFYRYVLNDSLRWYDELASVLLAWITYFGAALATQKRAHMGFGSLIISLPPRPRLVAFAIAEVVVYVVFVTLAWAGWRVLQIMDGMSLESLPWASLQIVQGIIPVGCALIVLAQIASTPDALQRLRAGRDADRDEIDAEIARAAADTARGASRER